jgi:iron complex transport system substrate-binding protein
MRLWPAFLALAVAGCDARPPAVPSAAARPLRVMSINLCTDQLVLALLPPQRIASVTWLARDPSGSLMSAAASKVSINHGLAEEVLAQKPDLVLSGTFTAPALRTMLQKAGYPLLEVADAVSIDDIRTITRQVAAALGEPARGEALIGDMDAKFARLARSPGPPIRILAWNRDGPAAGRGSLYDAIIDASGAHNVADDLPGRAAGPPDIETLIAANPALIVQGAIDAEGASLGDNVAHHRLVRLHWRDRTLSIRQAYYGCGTPMIADAALRLRDQLGSAAKRATPPLLL